MSGLTWRQRSDWEIGAIAREWLRERGKTLRDLPALSKKERKELLRVVRQGYPFGEPANHPYKAWCQAVREFRYRLFPETRPPEPIPGPPPPPPPLGGLFAGVEYGDR